jgi:chorismate synthase
MSAPGFDLEEAERNSLRVPHREYAELIRLELEKIRAEGDSAGGLVQCGVWGLPPGLGDPVFDKLDARLAEAILSIGAVKGLEFGAGFAAASGRGSGQNDRPLDDGARCPPDTPGGIPPLGRQSNNAGGILGGISTGMPLEFIAAFKPVPSIAAPQKALDREGRIREIAIAGRHDVCIVPRAVPVVEAMTALTLADMLLLRRLNR